MKTKLPEPRERTRAVWDALATWAAFVRATFERHRSVKVAFGAIVVASLMALGATAPSRTITVESTSSTAGSSAAMPEVLIAPPVARPVAPSSIAVALAPAAVASTSAAALPDSVCINDANPEMLRRLPGVGEKRAKAIVELRTRLGKLKRPEDLLKVKGLGRKRLAKIRPLLRFACDPPTGIVSDASAPPQ